MCPQAMSSEQTQNLGVASPIQEKSVSQAAGTARLISLDVFRGFIMFWIVGGSGLLLGLQTLGHNRVIDTLIYHLNHTAWEGLRFYDCIWPSFMLMVGVSVSFSYAKRSLTQSWPQMLAHALKRVAVLFLLGSLRESAHLGAPYWVEISSALQPIAIAYLVAFLLAGKPARVQAAMGGLILAGYALLLAFVPVPGIGAASYKLNANLVYAVDIALLGKTHPVDQREILEGWGTVLSTIPTISTTLFGLLLGGLLRNPRAARSKAKIIAVAGIAGLALGYALSFFIPVIMKMWTASYGILTASWACLMLLVFYWIVDVRGYRKWAFPFVVIGANALAAYLMETVTRLHLLVSLLTRNLEASLGSLGPLFGSIVFLGVEWLILYWMYRRRIFLTA
jgi:predicted acyltransferase